MVAEAMEVIRIGDAARRLGVSRSTLRVWEERGLIKPARRRGPAQERYYTEADLAAIREVAYGEPASAAAGGA